MKRLTPTGPRRAVLPLLSAILLMVLLLPQPASLAATTPTHKEQSGNLPKSGSIALRSGLQWMNESSPLFRELRAEAKRMLTQRGLTVHDVPDSFLAPLPPELGGPATGGKAQTSSQKKAGANLTLGSYSEATGVGKNGATSRIAQGDASQDLFFTYSQLQGTPVMFRGGRIPGRLPSEMISHDAHNLDYVIICRVAAVSPGFISAVESPLLFAGADNAGTGTEAPLSSGDPDDFVTAAGPMRGVDTLGYGASMPSVAPRSSYGTTPGDYARGYEGNSPNDPWNREADMKARDYQLKNSPPAAVATPPAATGITVPPREPSPSPSLPKPPLPGDTDMPAISPGPAPSNPPQSPSASVAQMPPGSAKLFKGKKPAIAGYALEMECYDLTPAKAGKKPTVVWRCTVQQRADKRSLVLALPEMVRTAFSAKAK